MILRKLTVFALVVFVTTSSGYMLVYLGRALRLDGPSETVVRLWHGDDLARSILLAVFIVLAVLLLGILWLSRLIRGEAGSVKLRRELADWLETRAADSQESTQVVAERAIAMYRAQLEPPAPRGADR